LRHGEIIQSSNHYNHKHHNGHHDFDYRCSPLIAAESLKSGFEV
jgi:hypothetical protein